MREKGLKKNKQRHQFIKLIEWIKINSFTNTGVVLALFFFLTLTPFIDGSAISNSNFAKASATNLVTIAATELLASGSGSYKYSPSANYSVNWSLSSPNTTSTFQSGGTTNPSILTVSRTISNIWTWTFTSGKTTPTYSTSYSVSDFTNGTSVIPASAITINKITHGPTHTGQGSNTNWTLWEDVTLSFDLGKATKTGTYTGTINMTVSGTNF